MKANNHYEWLDSIRGFAALYVLFHHAVRQVTIEGHHANDLLFRIMGLLSGFGHYAVDVFIVLSGYCLMLPVIKRGGLGSVVVFYVRRSFRILPPYYAVVVLCLIVNSYLLSETDDGVWAHAWFPTTNEDILRHFLLIHQWFSESAGKINGALWSIGVEYQIYFLFPLLLILSRRIGDAQALLLLSVFCYGLWAVFFNLNIMNPSHTGSCIYYLLLFYMGMMSSKYSSSTDIGFINYWKKQPSLLEVLSIAGILGIAVSSFLLNKYAIDYWVPFQIQSALVGFFTSLLFIAKATKSSTNKKTHITEKFLQFIGKMGFSFYLIHDPVVALCWKYIVSPLNFSEYWLQALTITIVGLFVATLVSYIFYNLIELPSHKLSQSFKASNVER
ncbi:MAG: acyltransferase [Methylophilus sp.]|nr:acyltransferase [Methylophilus sp.]